MTASSRRRSVSSPLVVSALPVPSSSNAPRIMTSEIASATSARAQRALTTPRFASLTPAAYAFARRWYLSGRHASRPLRACYKTNAGEGRLVHEVEPDLAHRVERDRREAAEAERDGEQDPHQVDDEDAAERRRAVGRRELEDTQSVRRVVARALAVDDGVVRVRHGRARRPRRVGGVVVTQRRVARHLDPRPVVVLVHIDIQQLCGSLWVGCNDATD